MLDGTDYADPSALCGGASFLFAPTPVRAHPIAAGWSFRAPRNAAVCCVRRTTWGVRSLWRACTIRGSDWAASSAWWRPARVISESAAYACVCAVEVYVHSTCSNRSACLQCGGATQPGRACQQSHGMCQSTGPFTSGIQREWRRSKRARRTIPKARLASASPGGRRGAASPRGPRPRRRGRPWASACAGR